MTTHVQPHDWPTPLDPDPASHWSIEPGVVFLNHGSFGACPRPVLEYQHQLQRELEAQPMRFLWRQLWDRLAAARESLGEFVGASPDDLAFVTNATTGVNTVLRSLDFQPGDELIVTNHEYGACANAIDFVAERSGATLVRVDIPLPLASPGDVTGYLLEAVTDKTRLVLIDHVTSPTALIFPLAEIVSELRERGVDTLVDGAHAPGMVDLDIEQIGPAYYTGNCHKWMCAPKGAGFLYVHPDRQSQIHPLVISHGRKLPTHDKSRFRLEFDWVGTRDPSAWLTVPRAIEFLGSLLGGGWPELRERNRRMALAARRLLCDTFGVQPPCPESMIGSIATLPLPVDNEGPNAWFPHALPLQNELRDRYRIEIPIMPWPRPPKQMVRLSAQLYNRPDDYHQLAAALCQLMDI